MAPGLLQLKRADLEYRRSEEPKVDLFVISQKTAAKQYITYSRDQYSLGCASSLAGTMLDLVYGSGGRMQRFFYSANRFRYWNLARPRSPKTQEPWP